MKVVSKFVEYEDGMGGYLTITIDGVSVFSVQADPECPEDFSFYRNLNDCFSIPALMKKAYEAGVRGEPFEAEEVDKDD